MLLLPDGFAGLLARLRTLGPRLNRQSISIKLRDESS
jgi:hypothetical protein